MKTLVNKALLVERLRRFWYLAALQLAGAAFLLLIIRSNGIYNSYRIMGEVLSLEDIYIKLSVMLIPLFTALIFSPLFKTAEGEITFALPYSKDQFFVTNVLAGSVLMIIPLILFSVGLTFPVYAYENFVQGELINPLSSVAMFFLKAFMTEMYYFALGLTAILINGNIITYAIVGLSLQFVPMMIYGLYEILKSFFILGTPMNMGQGMDFWMRMFSPIMTAGTQMFGNPSETQNEMFYVIYIVTAVVLLGLAFWLNRVRKQERAGKTFVFVPVKNVLVFFASLAGSLVCTWIGLIFLRFFAGKVIANDVVILIFIAVFFIAFYFPSHMAVDLTVRVKHKVKDIKWHFAALGGIALLGYIFFWFDPMGYVRYVPKAEDIESVSIDTSSWWYYAMDQEAFVTDPDIIEMAVAAHKDILENRGGLREASMVQSLAAEYPKNDKLGFVRDRSFIYKLKNGKYVVRDYTLPVNLIKSSGLNDLWRQDEVILSMDPVSWELTPLEDISNFELYFSIPSSDKSGLDIKIENPEHFTELADIVRKDIISVGLKEADFIEGLETTEDWDRQFARNLDEIVLSVNIRTKQEDKELKETGGLIDNYTRLTDMDTVIGWLDRNGYDISGLEDLR